MDGGLADFLAFFDGFQFLRDRRRSIVFLRPHTNQEFIFIAIGPRPELIDLRFFDPRPFQHRQYGTQLIHDLGRKWRILIAKHRQIRANGKLDRIGHELHQVCARTRGRCLRCGGRCAG
jgi:hypothetical protein